jgi:sugar phosphate isomerase/epimerase
MHPISGFEITSDKILEKVMRLQKVCESIEVYLLDKPITVALENLFPGNADKVLHQVLPSLDTRCFSFCYDSSHEQVDGPNEVILPYQYRSLLSCVHLSDRIKPFVDHVIPGHGFVDFVEIKDALKEINYQGVITLELMIDNDIIKDVSKFLSKAYTLAKEIEEAIK